MSALPLSCISTSVSVLSFLALLQVQGRWHSKLPIGMDGNHFSKSACDALYSTYKQGGSSGNHPNFIPSETRSPYSAGCLPFCNERKTIIPNCLTSWAQTQQKTCHNYWQGMHCRVTGILWLLIILFLYYIIMCPAVLLQNTLNTSLHHHISLLLNWETITQRLKKWRRIIKGNWGWSWPPFLARLTLKCSHYLVFEGLQQLQAPFS